VPDDRHARHETRSCQKANPQPSEIEKFISWKVSLSIFQNSFLLEISPSIVG